MNRATMQGLKAAKEDEHRQFIIKNAVNQIYRAAITYAQTHADTLYKHEANIHWFSKADLPDILSQLQILFPDCTVTFQSMMLGPDGKLYDISTMDAHLLPLINSRLNQEFIVIDWS
ncbi:MAG: hypothetical protein EBY22_14575 [Gammaproteobacteria bacterium]|nr:hypothetical protein [Gammaproteobacteria bacterium]